MARVSRGSGRRRCQTSGELIAKLVKLGITIVHPTGFWSGATTIWALMLVKLNST